MIPPRRMNVKGDPLWSRPFLFLNLSFFLVFSSISFLYLYPLVLNDMGSDRQVIGWVMGLFSLAAVMSRPFMGKLSARKGEHRVITLGIGVVFLSAFAYNFITAVGPAMLLLRVVHGIGFSAYVSASFSLAAKGFPPAKRGEAFSMVGVSLMAAVALAPPFGEFLIRHHGFHALYAGATGSAGLAWLAASLAIRSGSPSFPDDESPSPKYGPLIRNKAFCFLLISTLIFAHSQSTVSNFLALICEEGGGSAGLFFFTAYVTAILVMLSMGRRIDRYGNGPFLRLAYPLFCMGVLLIPATVCSGLFPGPAIMFGIGIGLLFPIHNALAASHGTLREKPAVMSLFTGIYDTGFVSGAVISGWVAYLTHLDSLFIITSSLTFLGFLVVLFSPLEKCCDPSRGT